MIGEIRQNFTEASASVGLILATALIVIFDRFLPIKDKNDQRETIAFMRSKFQHYRLLLSDEIWFFGSGGKRFY